MADGASAATGADPARPIDLRRTPIFHLVATLTAIATAWAHGLHGPLAWLLAVLGAACDLNQFPWCHGGVRLRIGRLVLPVRLYFHPIWTFYAIGIAVAGLSAVWFALPDACWPAANALVDRQSTVAGWRFGTYPDFCEIPHGAAIVLAQITLPALVVGVAALSLTSARFDGERMLAETWRHLRPRLRKSRMPLWLAELLLLGLAVLFMPWLPFAYDPTGHTRFVAPHLAYVHFLQWLVFEFGMAVIVLQTIAGVSVPCQRERPDAAR